VRRMLPIFLSKSQRDLLPATASAVGNATMQVALLRNRYVPTRTCKRDTHLQARYSCVKLYVSAHSHMSTMPRCEQFTTVRLVKLYRTFYSCDGAFHLKCPHMRNENVARVSAGFLCQRPAAGRRREHVKLVAVVHRGRVGLPPSDTYACAELLKIPAK
ncbi:hypothetical protein EVAR_72817_1, partial [Eumeta japonica]